MNNVSYLPIPQATLEDEEIKAIALANHNYAIDLTVRKYRDRIFNHAYYVLKDYQKAMDVAQEVFIKAMRESRFFEPDFKMKAWLFRVTSNLCFNIVRDRRRRTGILDSMPKPRAVEPQQVELIFHDERQQSILQGIHRLTPKHREILLLRYYSDLSYAEIADVLKIKLGTVMSRLSRAKCRLMEALQHSGVVQD